MTLRKMFFCFVMAACVQIASAGQTDSAGAGTVDAILDYCIKVNDENAPRYRAMEKALNVGGGRTGASRVEYEQTTAELLKLKKDDIAAACAKAAKGWN
jgi:hypothetical protein